MKSIKLTLNGAFIILVLLITNCSVTPTLLDPHQNQLDKKIKNLRFGLEGDQILQLSSIKTGTVVPDAETIFRRTLEQNICEKDSVVWGYIDVQVTFDNWAYDYKRVPLTVLLSLPPYGLVFWVPWGGKFLWFTRTMQIEVGIYDSKKNIVKKYIIDDSVVSGVNLYDKMQTYNKKRLSGITVMHKIMREFGENIERDAIIINQVLTDAGPIK